MRKIVFCVLSGVLLAVVLARSLLPESARASSDEELYGYNISEVSLPALTQTAGSALISELDSYYFFREPTAKNDWTGVFEGKNLILICAEDWRVSSSPSRYGESALYRLDHGSARIPSVYRTDWYQGAAGVMFALLTGVIPTTLDDMTALQYTGEQDVWLPYTLARCLTDRGYKSFAFIKENSLRGGFETLGFETVIAYNEPAAEDVSLNLNNVTDEARFFAFWQWDEEDGEAALEMIFDGLKSARRLDDTVICLLAGAQTDDRASLYIYGAEAANAISQKPCSALDVTPTLLNLFGLTYDSRFLSGLDIFSANSEPGVASSATQVVSLCGSAFSDWVTDAGCYSSAGSIFRQTADCFERAEDVSAYVHEVSRLVYDRYIYTRRAMEYNYFKAVLG